MRATSRFWHMLALPIVFAATLSLGSAAELKKAVGLAA